MQIVLIAADHAGFETKEYLKKNLAERGYAFKDFGTFSAESMDYADVVHPLAREINAGNYPLGIILCGSGNGVNMTANKYPNVRSALCWQPEIAALARQHNDANVLAIPARFVDKPTALDLATTFLTTEFEGGRHCRRVEKIRS
ncbi:MAG: RpiB/LacA/LacB family sugar-phosphate isomerase [Lentimicrobiaceae bacterium]|nr:RpiB/LacA/LacB family sugar-phosphate isomerase [Lentimicrobiaceae bacterium]